MKRIAVLLFFWLFVSCDILDLEYEDDPDEKEFTFINSTSYDYYYTAIYVGEVKDDETIKIHKTEYIDIPSREGNQTSMVKTGLTKDWEKSFYSFMNDRHDVGCLIIELSDGQRLFFEINYYEDLPWSGLDNFFSYEITIKEDGVFSFYSTEMLKNISVENYTILYP